MNVSKVISQLSKKYPNKKIIKNNEKNPTEILCEIDPSTDHPEYSLVVSVLDKSVLHIHRKTKEQYKVLKGILTIYKNNKKFMLKKEDTITVNPGEVHFAIGHETWFECYSEPGWTVDDHILY